MSRPTIQDLSDLLTGIVIPFYAIERKTPLPPFELGRYEDDAQHSWSVALLAAALAPHVDATLDIGKVCQFAIVHDLVEVESGDVSNFAPADEKARKSDREAAALQMLEQKLAAFPWIAATMHEYEAQTSQEARFVKSVDKVITLLFDYVSEGYFDKVNHITIEHWQEQLQKQREKARSHAGAFEYYDELWNLFLANPQFFYRPEESAK